MNKKILIILIVALSFLPYGYAQNSQESYKNKNILCEVIEKVYHDEDWKVCGNILVFDDGNYLYKSHNLWQNSQPLTKTFEGKIPKKIYAKLKQSILNKKWPISKGKYPTYELGIDNTRAIHPDGVIELVDYLQTEILKNETIK